MTSPTRDKLRKAVAEHDGSTDLATMSRVIDAMADDASEDDPKARKRRRILRVATEQFVLYGYRRSSIDAIARAAHVAKGTVYLYFTNKAELLVAAITEEKVQYARKLQPLLQQERPAAERLKLWLTIALQMSAELPLLSRLLSGDAELMAALEDMDEVLGVKTTELQLSFISSLIDEANAPHAWTQDDIRERGQVLLSLVYVSGNFGDADRRFGLSLPRHAELLADILVEGIAAEASLSTSQTGLPSVPPPNEGGRP
ncbi:MAG: TetR/AcrR family transcriptional regulator [Deltaproteobacteria bacterium]|nr:TetR/AcrR family transcriptional regulator [Deltaproteobacteria bacterium]